ncbi:30S ribosomal protein S4e [Candidatus Woesearchaeota archaeon]|jgi:small subunit ribosomal protein S4e|nr:30S ribosomal protein S4e [Candidatus Woesearchaeota archaeon]
MKNHLKAIAVPKTWPIDRKKNVYITRPKPGTHKLYFGMPLGVILRDFLHLTSTIREAGKLLNNNELLVDGKRVKDTRAIVGLFDAISIPNTKQNFRILLDKKGRLTIHEIDAKESKIKPCKVINKTILPKGKIQINLYDGRNITSDQKCAVGDTVVFDTTKNTISTVLELKPGVLIFLTQGKHAGNVGELVELNGEKAICKLNGENIETTKKYLFVLGEKKPVIKLME